MATTRDARLAGPRLQAASGTWRPPLGVAVQLLAGKLGTRRACLAGGEQSRNKCTFWPASSVPGGARRETAAWAESAGRAGLSGFRPRVPRNLEPQRKARDGCQQQRDALQRLALVR